MCHTDLSTLAKEACRRSAMEWKLLQQINSYKAPLNVIHVPRVLELEEPNIATHSVAYYSLYCKL